MYPATHRRMIDRFAVSLLVVVVVLEAVAP